MQSLLDQVNILIKMKVGDPYRLEHIKLILKQKRTVYGSDRAYLDHLIHDYIEQVKTQKKLAKIRGEDPYEEDSETMVSEEDIEDEDDDIQSVTEFSVTFDGDVYKLLAGGDSDSVFIRTDDELCF